MSKHSPLAAFAGYGVELEYMVVDRQSLSVRPIADRLLDHQSADRPRGAMAWSNEVVLHLLEVKNRAPVPALDALPDAFNKEVAVANAELAGLDAWLMPGAMHPWMDPKAETRLWPHAHADIYATYDRIFDCRRHGWANLQSMHLNLPFADDEELVRLHAAVRLVLPILPALAASSPFAEGRPAGALDYRMEVYRGHQAKLASTIGEVIPDDLAGRADYARHVLAPMYRELAAQDPDGVLRHEWLNARGAIVRFDRRAIEVRVIDLQECPLADLAIAAATAAVVKRFYERPDTLAAQRAVATPALAGILRACIVDAEATVIADADYLAVMGIVARECTAGELWHHLLAQFIADADNGMWRPPLELILRQGPLARRLLRAAGPRPDHRRLMEVYGELCRCLAEGRQFTA